MLEKFYGDESQEVLNSISWNEAIEEATKNNKEFPLKLYEFKRQDVFDDNYHKNFLDNFLEDLDMNYGDPDGDYTKPTDAMIRAAKTFIDVIKKEYKVFWLEKTGVERIYKDKDNYIEKIE